MGTGQVVTFIFRQLYPGEIFSGASCIGDWLGSGVIVDVVAKREILQGIELRSPSPVATL
jgi:hypothetical protein